MPVVRGISQLLLCGLLSGGFVTNAIANRPSQAPPSQKQQKPAAEQPAEDQSAPDQDEDLAPAALQIDVSQSSPLIQKLYQATRETKEQASLDRLAEAKKMLDDGADVKSTDRYGRTALHWAVFGSSYSTKPKVIVAYEEIADSLVQHGVDIARTSTTTPRSTICSTHPTSRCRPSS